MILRNHWGALEYDLMTRTPYRLGCVGKTLPWPSLVCFIEHLPVDSALYRETHPDIAEWANPVKTAAILADILDSVNMMRWEFSCAHTPRDRQKPKQPKKYPRQVDKADEQERKPFDREAFKAEYFGE